MAEEIITQTASEPTGEQSGSRAQERITDLSNKVELTAKERDELKALREQDQKKIQDLEREAAFSNGFADILGIHPSAREHKDEIKAKVSAGYSVEDATFAVLGKAGKLGGVAAPTAAPQVAGGSAANTLQSGQKEIKDMSLAEKREILSKELGWS